MKANQQAEMPQVRSRHWRLAHKPRQDGGGTSQRQKGRLAQGQAEEEGCSLTARRTFGSGSGIRGYQ